MPNYDLRCEGCNHEFTAMASMSDRTMRKVICPECGSNALEAVFNSAPAYIKNLKSPACPSAGVCGASRCQGHR
jgi:putative FmdB family regulatory protein